MTTSKRVFVLVGDEQVPVSPSDVAGTVSKIGFRRAAENYGFSESTLRGFLAENGFVGRKNVVYEKPSELSVEGQAALDTVVAVVTQLGG